MKRAPIPPRPPRVPLDPPPLNYHRTTPLPPRRSRGTRAMQMLVGALVWGLLSTLIAIAWADWLTGYDTLSTLFNEAIARLFAGARPLNH